MKKFYAFLSAAAFAAAALAWNPFRDDSSWSSYDSPPPPPPPPNRQYGGWDWQGQPPPPPPPNRQYGGWDWQGQPPPPSPHDGDWRHDRYDRHDRNDSKHGGKHDGKRKGYALLGEFAAAGGAKEVSIGGNRTKVSIEFTAGTTSINSIVLRSGGRKTPMTVVTRFNQGQRYDFGIGRDVTGLRISCSGNGRFRVYAK